MSKTSPKLDLFKVGKTNLYHSDEERRLIDEAICRTTEALQRVREEKRAIIDLERYLGARAPIKRLPDDVLCNMFEWHCQVASPVDIPFSSWSIPPQITISHVCSTWRQIMLHIPAFWCNIRLGSDLAMDMGKEADIAHAWLSRAKSLPCSVEIKFENSSWPHLVRQIDSHQTIVEDLISLYKLKKTSSHVSGLPFSRALAVTIAALPFELHKLSSLTSFTLFDYLLRIPGLVDPEDGSRFASIPWHQLRHINIRMSFPMPFCLRILGLSSVLETCSLAVHVDSSFTSSPPSSIKEPIHCSQLREFKVDMHSLTPTDPRPEADDIIIDPFLCSLRCPNLKSLTVGFIERSTTGFILPPSINLQTFLRMQQVSGMHLEELIIYDTMRDLEVLPLLASFPSLRRLVLPQTINITKEAMDELGSGSIAPFLADLTIKKGMRDLEGLFRMIKTRSSVGQDSKRKYEPTPFKSVILYCKSLPLTEDTDTIKEINQSGVNLNVNWRGYDSDESDDGYGMDGFHGGNMSHFEDYDEDSSDSFEWSE